MENDFMRGVTAGVPIALGYLSVSFAFGIMAATMGLYPYQALLISMLCVTSAGQLAGITVMVSPGHYIDMLISQLTINLRYSFMSISLTQKVEDSFNGIKRWLLGFMMTDEIFAVASHEERVSARFFTGLIMLPYIGWAVGTIVGAMLGSVMPQSVLNALGIALYAMFVAIVVPDMKKSLPIAAVVALAALLSICFTYIPLLSRIPTGISISICAVVAAFVLAILCPIKDAEEVISEEINTEK